VSDLHELTAVQALARMRAKEIGAALERVRAWPTMAPSL
jgi:hypothetical protein